MIYQFDNAAAIENGNCASGACSPALTLKQPNGSTVVIESPQDVIDVDFNYTDKSCTRRTASLTVNARTYAYTGTDLCAHRNVFFFYVAGGKAVLLERPDGWTLE